MGWTGISSQVHQGDALGKLSKLKEWLTVAEAAQQLTIEFGETVTEADVLHLVLTRQLRLSIYLVSAVKAQGEWQAITTPEFRPLIHWDPPCDVRQRTGQLIIISGDEESPLDGEFAPICDESRGTGPDGIIVDHEVVTLDGVFDLPMIGDERFAIKSAHQKLLGGAAITHQFVDGVFVQAPDYGRLYYLQEPFDENKYKARADAKLVKLTQHIVDKNIGEEEAGELLEQHHRMEAMHLEHRKSVPSLGRYFPADGLPEGSFFVVRTEALAEFKRKNSDDGPLTDVDQLLDGSLVSADNDAPVNGMDVASPDGVMVAGAESVRRWDEFGLRRLLSESREGATQLKLAEKYGVTRQRIATLLKEAKEQFDPRKAQPFDQLKRGNGKK